MVDAITEFWKAINLMLMIFIIPIAFINKIAFAWLTQRPFIMLPIYWVDLAIVAVFSYLYYNHILWLNTENDALGLA